MLHVQIDYVTYKIRLYISTPQGYRYPNVHYYSREGHWAHLHAAPLCTNLSQSSFFTPNSCGRRLPRHDTQLHSYAQE